MIELTERASKNFHRLLEDEGVAYDLDDIRLVTDAGYPDIRRVINSAQRQVVDG